MGGVGFLPADFLPVSASLTGSHLEIKFCFLAGVAFAAAGFDLCLGLRDRFDLIFPTGDFSRYAHAVGDGGLICGFSQGEQFLDFGFELRFELDSMLVRQGTMPAGVGVNFGAVEADRPEAGELVLVGDLQHLDKGRFELLAETAAKGGQGVVIGVLVAGEVAEGERVVGGAFDLAVGKGAGSIAIAQQAEQSGRGVGITAATRIRTFDLGEVEVLDHGGNVAGQVGFRQPFLH